VSNEDVIDKRSGDLFGTIFALAGALPSLSDAEDAAVEADDNDEEIVALRHAGGDFFEFRGRDFQLLSRGLRLGDTASLAGVMPMILISTEVVGLLSWTRSPRAASNLQKFMPSQMLLTALLYTVLASRSETC
jgi:hypothetical protein